MRRIVGLLAMTALGFAVAITLSAAPAAAQEEAAEEEAPATGDPSFVGVDGCKTCHKTVKSGDQYTKWLESGHAKAFTVLGTEEAKAVAAKAGVQGNPQEADQCLQCHVTAHGVKAELIGAKFKKEDGVGCESCHGPGSKYKAKKIMQDHDASVKAGMVVPTEAMCKSCHNEKSPTYKAFDYKAAVEKIAHPTPKETEAAK
jgi:hypothetical protein